MISLYVCHHSLEGNTPSPPKSCMRIRYRHLIALMVIIISVYITCTLLLHNEKYNVIANEDAPENAYITLSLGDVDVVCVVVLQLEGAAI